MSANENDKEIERAKALLENPVDCQKDRLIKIIDGLLGCDPLDDYGVHQYVCRYCGTSPEAEDGHQPDIRYEDHLPDCAYIQGLKLLEELSHEPENFK